MALLIGFDVVGLFLPWTRIDHVAHLGGSCVGLASGHHLRRPLDSVYLYAASGRLQTLVDSHFGSRVR